MKKIVYLLILVLIGLNLFNPVWAVKDEPVENPELTPALGIINDAVSEEQVLEYELNIKVDSPKALVFIDEVQVDSGLIRVKEGKHTLGLKGEGIKEKEVELFINKNMSVSLKADPPQSQLTHVRTISTGSLPKGMEFSRDGKFLFIALLGQSAVDVVDWNIMGVSSRIEPTVKKYSSGGFVEIGVSPLDDAVLTSQMTTGSVHRIPLTGDQAFQFTDSVLTQGNWSKVITFSKEGRMFAVSNWTSYDVSFFTYPEMEFIKKVKIPGIPRGMVFAEEDKTLYVSNYSNGSLHKIDIEAGKIMKTIPSPRKGALRHLAIDEEKQVLYASDMYWRLIYIYDLKESRLIRQIKVDSNPNTIALTPDKKYLFVSCRGPNAKSSYLDRSPRSGRLYMIDCETQEVLEYRVLGNQPTALAVHPSGEYAAVSNFRDNNIEIYRIEGAR